MPRPVRILLLGLGGLTAICMVLLVAWGIDARRHDDRVARNVSLAGIRVGGLTEPQLRPVVARIVGLYDEAEVQVEAPKGSFETSTRELGVKVSEKRTVDGVMGVGRHGAVPGRVVSWLLSPLRPRAAPVRVLVDLSTAWPTVRDKDPGPRQEPTEPSVNGEGEELRVVDGKPGKGIDPRAVVRAIPDAAKDGPPIVVKVGRGDVPPRYTELEAERLLEHAALVAKRPVPVRGGGKSAQVDGGDIRSWIRSRATDEGLELVFDEKAVVDDLERVLKGVGENPVEARFSVDDGRVIIHPGRDGTRCCAPAAARRLEQALLGRQTPAAPVDVPLRPEPPKLSTDDAEKLKIVEPIASFTTEHPAGQPRVRNIHRIADLVRGTVIRPGSTFSVNDTVGRRTAANGFVSAPVIEEGRFSEGVGGGISQFATTLFNAAFFAGLEFPEYQSHSIYISRYPYGREATLNFPKPDLKIRNTTPHGVLVWPTYNERSITVTLYSTKHFDAAQTGQTRSPSGACTRVSTERTRTRVTDGERLVDRVAAVYRPAEGVNCR